MHGFEPEVRAEGARNCGCAWQRLDDGMVRFTRRCEEHEPMRRSIERWEIDIVRPGNRAQYLAAAARLAAERCADGGELCTNPACPCRARLAAEQTEETP